MPPFADFSNQDSCGPLLEIEESTPISAKASARPSVTFSEYDEIFDIPHVDDLSDDEIDAVWFTSDDLDEIKSNCKDIIVSMGDSDDETEEIDGECTRGLDQHTREYSRQRKRIMKKLYETVYDVQSFQALECFWQSSAISSGA